MYGIHMYFYNDYYVIYIGTLTHYDTIIYPDEPLLLLNKRIIRERVSAFLRLSREHEIEEIVPDKDTIVRRRSLEIHLVKFHAEIVNGNILNNGASELAYVCREIGNIYDDFCSQTVEIHHHNEQQRPEYRDLKIDRSSLKEVNDSISGILINLYTPHV